MKKNKEQVIKKDNFMFKIAVTEVIFLAMFIFTASHLDRIATFNNLVGSFVSIFKYASIIIFFISTDFVFMFYGILTIWMIEGQIIKSDWVQRAYNMDKKYDFFIFIFKVFAILLFLMVFIITPCSVSGSSMSPTFETGDNVLTFNLYSTPKKGDVVVFDAKAYTDEDAYYIKRVVATPGDSVDFSIELNKLYVNGEEVEGFYVENYRDVRLSKDYNLVELRNLAKIVSTKDYSFLNDLFSKLNNKYHFIMPDNKYLVLGDNRNISQDSRFFGLIDKKAIYGKVFLRIYPFNKMGYYE